METSRLLYFFMHDKRREANTSPSKCSTKCLSQTEKRGLGLRGRAYKDSVDIKHPPSFIVYLWSNTSKEQPEDCIRIIKDR